MREEVEIRPNGSRRVRYFCEGESRTRQEFKQECDLGALIRRFSRSSEGLHALLNAQGYVSGRFEDVSSVPDYRTALDQVNRAAEVFTQLPAALRKRFDNDAARFLDFVDNPKNVDELRSMGLLKPEVNLPEKPAVAGGSAPPVKG